MSSGEKLSYSAFPAGHIFRLGIAVLVLTCNCVIMRVAATFALQSTKETQIYCRDHQMACGVSAYSVLGSLLPIFSAVLTGSFAIVAAKRFFKWAFIVTFFFGCVLMTLSFLLNLLFNGLRHGFNIAPLLVPDILEIILFCVINLLTMVVGILCVKSLVRDRSERYVASSAAATTAAETSEFDGEIAETRMGYENGYTAVTRLGYENAVIAEEADADYETVPDDGPSTSSNHLRPPTEADGHRRSNSSSPRQKRRSQLPRSASGLSSERSRVQAEVTVVVANESGKVTNYDIFAISGNDR